MSGGGRDTLRMCGGGHCDALLAPLVHHFPRILETSGGGGDQGWLRQALLFSGVLALLGFLRAGACLIIKLVHFKFIQSFFRTTHHLL